MIRAGDEKAEILDATTDPDGYSLKYLAGDRPQRYFVSVTRPSLGLTCSAGSIQDERVADEIVELCRSLRAVK